MIHPNLQEFDEISNVVIGHNVRTPGPATTILANFADGLKSFESTRIFCATYYVLTLLT